MPRKYEKVQELLPIVKQLTTEGYTPTGCGNAWVGQQKSGGAASARERKKDVQGIPKQRSRKPAKTLRSLRSCSSTVTRAFNTPLELRCQSVA